MGRGTHRGFITFDELNKSLGKRNLSDENLEQAFMHILDENVALVEKKSDFFSTRATLSSKMCKKACSRFSSERFLLPNDLFNSSKVIKPLWVPRPISLANDLVIILSTIVYLRRLI